MIMVERKCSPRRGIKRLVGLLALAGIVNLPLCVGAITRIGNSEIQIIYEQQHAFQFNGDPTNALEWVQWRNELQLEYGFEDLVENYKLFGRIPIPFIRKADFSMMYRGRFDPVYTLRDKYRRIYNED